MKFFNQVYKSLPTGIGIGLGGMLATAGVAALIQLSRPKEEGEETSLRSAANAGLASLSQEANVPRFGYTSLELPDRRRC